MATGRPRVVTFDCYGTLIDWETGIDDAFAAFGGASGWTVGRAAVLRAHAEIEPRVQAEGYRTYREVLIETARRMVQQLGGEPITPEAAGFLPDSVAGWRPFPDTNAALERLARAGCRLGILSNIDDALLEGTLRHLTVDFELRVTAQQVRSYKPAHAHFLEARRRIGGESWLHAAQSWFHDVEPAAALGIPVAWVNRKHETATGTAQATLEVSDLATLADRLLAG